MIVIFDQEDPKIYIFRNICQKENTDFHIITKNTCVDLKSYKSLPYIYNIINNYNKMKTYEINCYLLENNKWVADAKIGK